ILYQQITESILKSMRKVQIDNLYQYLKSTDIMGRAAEQLRPMLDFNVEMKIAQRKLVELGQVLGRVFSFEMVLRLGDSGFRSELIESCTQVLQQEIQNLMASYKVEHTGQFVD